MTAAQLLRQARHRAQLTQAELALRLGTSQPVVARLESRNSNPTWETLSRALQATGYGLELAQILPSGGALDLDQLRQRLRLTPAQRLTAFQASQRRLADLRGAARAAPDD